MKWISGRISQFTHDEYATVYSSLSPSRKMRIDRYKREEDKMRSLLGELLLRRLLCESGVINPVICSAENGRPYIENDGLHVSISHCDDIAVCAVCEEPVGIDIEKIKPVDSRLIKRVCTESEERYICFSGNGLIEDRVVLERFFEIWTAKEAYFKKEGTGITNFHSIDTLILKKQTIKISEYIIQII